MSKQPSFRDLTELSAYLDGELNASALKRMKNRLARDPELASALDDLRLSRSVLRRTPKRRAPRNFSLSPQMVAKRPPMPRLVLVLNYAALAAMLLFVFSFTSPFGLGGSAAPAQEMMASAPLMMEEPAMEMAAAPPAADSALELEEEAPAAEMPAAEETGESLASAPPPETTAAGEPAEKAYAATMTSDAARSIPEVQPEPEPLLTIYQRTLVILLGLFAMLSWLLRQATISKWRKASK